MTTILDRTMREISACLGSGACSVQELATLALDRHGEFGAELGAYQVWKPALVLEQAGAADQARRNSAQPGSLAGLPISVKDLFGVTGYPTYAGTPRRLPRVWEQEGGVVRKLKQEGALVMGKTRMVELAFGGLGTNAHWGSPINPWDAATARVSGGSSSGAGVSLQEGSALMALGTDTACSVRVPAAWTGTVGLKTSKGRWPSDGLVPLSQTLDSVGILTRSVADACYGFAAIDPSVDSTERFMTDCERVNLPSVRIGILGSLVWGQCARDIADPLRTALRELEAGGAYVGDVAFPEFDKAAALYSSGHIAPPECEAFLSRQLPEWIDTLHETIEARLRGASDVKAHDYLAALAARQDLIASARKRWQEFDVLVTPTVPITAPKHSDVEELDDYVRLNKLTSPACNPVNMLDLCALSLPCGLDAHGIPVGLQLVARNGDEQRLLSVGRAVEKVLGTSVERIGRPPRCT